MSPMSPAALLAAAAAAAALSPLALHLSPFVWRGEQTEAAEGEAAAWSLRRRFPSLRDAGSAGPAFGGAVAMQSADARGRRAVSAAAGQRLQRRLSALSDAATSAAALWALRPPSRSLLQQQA
ncbi:hypothetical protein TSOC_005392 [Tetrabaena socialis]|uniref:Uncharacterized protein n=1 Tax=Tetrabaena socialis TaxID=47790 RepID=A0A2J8A6C4_9CHLO|nr:hypothetical protein TSOC_005392 [Tetrabaena socialis]|eukprot:PNH08082.1 hypothetical protein TSOC_005392 [Tetrabaena socialis]